MDRPVRAAGEGELAFGKKQSPEHLPRVRDMVKRVGLELLGERSAMQPIPQRRHRPRLADLLSRHLEVRRVEEAMVVQREVVEQVRRRDHVPHALVAKQCVRRVVGANGVGVRGQHLRCPQPLQRIGVGREERNGNRRRMGVPAVLFGGGVAGRRVARLRLDLLVRLVDDYPLDERANVAVQVAPNQKRGQPRRADPQGRLPRAAPLLLVRGGEAAAGDVAPREVAPRAAHAVQPLHSAQPRFREPFPLRVRQPALVLRVDQHREREGEVARPANAAVAAGKPVAPVSAVSGSVPDRFGVRRVGDEVVKVLQDLRRRLRRNNGRVSQQ